VRVRTTTLISDWEQRSDLGWAGEPPDFATAFEASAHGPEIEDLAQLTREVTRDPALEMWQLCGADDVGLLDTAAPPGTVRFVPAGAAFEVPLPNGTVKDSSGGCGIVRLVALRPRVVEWTWHEDDPDDGIGGGR
jgi:hypothetical protein